NPVGIRSSFKRDDAIAALEDIRQPFYQSVLPEVGGRAVGRLAFPGFANRRIEEPDVGDIEVKGHRCDEMAFVSIDQLQIRRLTDHRVTWFYPAALQQLRSAHEPAFFPVRSDE